jgi:hypothetical protein
MLLGRRVCGPPNAAGMTKTYYEDSRAPRREPMLMSETMSDCVMGTQVVSPVAGSVPVPKRRVNSSKTRKPEIWPVSYLPHQYAFSPRQEAYIPKEEPADTGSHAQQDGLESTVGAVDADGKGAQAHTTIPSCLCYVCDGLAIW